MSKKHEKNAVCAAQGKYCSENSELVKVDLCGEYFLFCKFVTPKRNAKQMRPLKNPVLFDVTAECTASQFAQANASKKENLDYEKPFDHLAFTFERGLQTRMQNKR